MDNERIPTDPDNPRLRRARRKALARHKQIVKNSLACVEYHMSLVKGGQGRSGAKVWESVVLTFYVIAICLIYAGLMRGLQWLIR